MFQSVKVKNLSLSKENVRRTNREIDIPSLAASILAQGLLQNLVVTPLKKAGHFTVKAGGRRLRALQLLIEQGDLPADHEVHAMVLADAGRSVEASLTENFQREPMNPADECTAFNHFIKQGSSAEDVAKRFGVTTRFVEQRVRLAELAPCVFDALAAGEITLGVAQAYAITADTDRQAQVFAQMIASYHGNNPDNVKRALLNGCAKPTDAKARFVGREAYVGAGGRIDRDLFANENDESWIDSQIIEQLAQAKLEEAAEQLATSEGLAFVTPVIATHVPYDLERQYHEFHPRPRDLTEDEEIQIDTLSDENDELIDQLNGGLEHDSPEGQAAMERHETIEAELERINNARYEVDPDLKGQLGTFVLIGQDGEVRVHTRFFSEKPVVDPKAPSSTGKTGSGGTGDGGDAGGDTVDQGARLSGTLTDELATQRRQILVAHLASDPAMALDLTIFLMAQKVVNERVPVAAHSTIRADEAAFPLSAFRDEGSLATGTIGEQRQALDQSWAGYTTMSERFDAFRQLDEEARAAWIGFAIARTLEPTLNVTEGYRVNGFHDHLGRLLDIKVEEWWRPTAQNFFGRVKKDIILDALEEIGGTTLRARYKDAKKGDLANTAGALCEGKGIIEAEIRDKALAWLPDAMRFDGIEKPGKLLPLASEEEPDEDDDGFEGGDDGEGEGDGADTGAGAGADGDEGAGADEAPEDLDQAA